MKGCSGKADRCDLLEALVRQMLRLTGDAFAEDPICPSLVDQDNWQENQGDNGH